MRRATLRSRAGGQDRAEGDVNIAAASLNFLGIDVRGLDLDAFFRIARLVYLATYLAWIALLVCTRRRVWAWGPVLLALGVWAFTTFPLLRPYGLQAPTSDRLRHVWWAATAAAGNPPWESGVVGQRTLEPLWSALVSLVALRDPARVMTVYPFLPALGLAATAAALWWAFRAQPLRATLVSFFVLLAATQPLDHLEPFRIFWARHFLLKPNHALGLALVPVLAGVFARPLDAARALAGAALLGLLGWVFVVDWALVCAGLVCFLALAALRRATFLRKADVLRLAAVLVASALVVAPFVFYLARHFPNAVSLSAGDATAGTRASPWGDERPAAHSLLFLATFDLGPHFPLALYGAFRAWRRGRRGDLVWLGVLAAAYLAWTATAVLYTMARARAADEVYWFLAFAVAVHAGLGAYALVRSAVAAWRRARGAALFATPRRLAAALLLAWLPLTLGWWWDPPRMDGHFTAALQPVPDDMRVLAAWLRERTRGTDVVLASDDAMPWVPALSGRRVVRAAPGVLPTAAELRERGVRVIVSAPRPGAADTPPEGVVVETFRTEALTAWLLAP
jgi:hypothetical protein